MCVSLAPFGWCSACFVRCFGVSFRCLAQPFRIRWKQSNHRNTTTTTLKPQYYTRTASNPFSSSFALVRLPSANPSVPAQLLLLPYRVLRRPPFPAFGFSRLAVFFPLSVLSQWVRRACTPPQFSPPADVHFCRLALSAFHQQPHQLHHAAFTVMLLHLSSMSSVLLRPVDLLHLPFADTAPHLLDACIRCLLFD